MRFKVGDKVGIIKSLNRSMNNVVPDMEKYAGKVATIERIDRKTHYILDIDNGEWCWNENFVEPFQFTKADLKPCMVVELSSGDIAIIGQFDDGLSVDYRNGCQCLILDDYEEDLKYGGGNYDIIKVYGYSNCAYQTTKATKDNRELLWERIEKSPQQIKLEELENKQREIADEIRKIREGM